MFCSIIIDISQCQKLRQQSAAGKKLDAEEHSGYHLKQIVTVIRYSAKSGGEFRERK